MLMVVFVVLMLLWLFGGGYVSNASGNFNFVQFGGSTLLPWICIAILGWVVFNGYPGPTIRP